MQRILGYSIDEINSKTMEKITHPDDLITDAALFQELLAGKRTQYQIEKRYFHKDGFIVRALAGVSLIRDEKGNPQYAIGMIEDITERKLAEEQLRESEDRYRSLFENAPVGVFYSTIAGKILSVNDEYARMLGYASPEEMKEIVNQSVIANSIYVTLDDRSHLIEKANATPGTWIRTELCLRRKDGTHITAKIIIRVRPENPNHLEGFVEDISERKQSEAQLRKLSLAVEQNPASIVITDIRGNIEYVNPKFTQVTGYTLEEAGGKTPRILKSGEKSTRRIQETVGNNHGGKRLAGRVSQ